MASITIPYAVADFIEMRERGFYYVDKTQYIAKLEDYKAPVFLRPRRFGKSLLVSTLACYYDRTKAHRFEELFGDTWIGNHPTKEHNRYMIIRYDFSAMVMSDHIQGLAQNFNDLNCGPVEVMVAHNRDLFGDFEFSNRGDASKMLEEVLTYARSHELPKVYILIDEYDVPLAKAFELGYYNSMTLLIRNLFENALKTNDSLKFAVLTGCMRISKESIFTGLNNLKVLSVADVQFDEYFGFTDSDVKNILEYYELSEHYDEIKMWYDGYRFGNVEVYCPWDVINYCDELRINNMAQPQNYWSNTSSNEAVKRFIQETDKGTVRKEIEKLIAGETIVKEIHQELTYQDMYASIENLWSVLFTTGYLTQTERKDANTFMLTIPNMEIRNIFLTQIMEYFKKTVSENGEALEKFCNALKDGNSEVVEQSLNNYLKRTISIRDTFVKKQMKENFYHGILLGILGFQQNWSVSSNKESGDGYSDILIETEDQETGIIIEIKYAETGNLEAVSEDALKQIEDRRYEEQLLEEGVEHILKYGIAFYKKKCKVMAVK